MVLDSDVELKFLANEPVDLGGMCFYVPTLREIIRIGEKEYNRLMSTLLINKDMVQELEGTDGFDELTNFDIAYVNCYHSKEFWKDMKDAINIFFKEEVNMSPVESAEELGFFFYFGGIDEDRRIDRSNFDYIQSLVMVANNVRMEKDDDYNPANEEVARVIREMEARKKKKPKPKRTMNLHSMISGLAWKPNDINIFNIFDLTIYQFNDGFFVTQNIDSYYFILIGTHTGNIDSKKIDYKKIHWANIIQNNEEEF